MLWGPCLDRQAEKPGSPGARVGACGWFNDWRDLGKAREIWTWLLLVLLVIFFLMISARYGPAVRLRERNYEREHDRHYDRHYDCDCDGDRDCD